MRNEGEMLNRTSGDLLHKLRQLRIWQQQQQQLLVQEKENYATLGEDGKFTAEYQTNYPQIANNDTSTTLRNIDVNQATKRLATCDGIERRIPSDINHNETMMMVPGHQMFTSNDMKTTTILRTPSKEISAPNPMLLTQKIELPDFSDDVLSNSSEVEGVTPIPDTASEITSNDDDEDIEQSDNESINDDEEDIVSEQYQHNTNAQASPKTFDDIPIQSGFKTFDQLLDEKLKDECVGIEVKDDSCPRPVSKRTFLRKREGLARYGMKTTSNNVSMAQHNQNMKRKVASNKQLHDDNNNKLSTHVIGPFKSIDVAMETVQPTTRHGSDKTISSQKILHNIEDSFQERMKEYDELDIVEKHELNEFELLEEAAANSSLSSNSSTVLRILGKRLQNAHYKNINNIPHQNTRIKMSPMKQDLSQSLIEHNTAEDDDENNDTLTMSPGLNQSDVNQDDPTLNNVSSTKLTSSNDFNDKESWSDNLSLLNTSTPNAKSHSSPNKTPTHFSPAPTSTLVAKLFPQLKKTQQSKQNEKLMNEVNTRQQDVVKKPDENSVMSQAVKTKLQELEKEIEKFREENAMLHKLREQQKKDLQEFHREKQVFEIYKSEELERIEKFKYEEERRLRRDKRVFEQYQKASKALPDKKEREEILSLKSKINKLEEEIKQRDSRWSATSTRFKDRIHKLENENKEMKDEIKILEKQNLELQRKEQQHILELQKFKADESKKVLSSEEVVTYPLPQSSYHDNESSEQFRTPPSSPVLTHQGDIVSITNTTKQPPLRPGTTVTTKQSPPIPHSGKYVKQLVPPPSHPGDSVNTKQPSLPGDSVITKQPSLPGNVVLEQLSPPPHPGNNDVVKQLSPSSLSGNISTMKAPSRPGKTVRFQNEEPQMKEIHHDDGKHEIIKPDGSRIVTFQNGTKKEISSDGSSVVVTFFNGDVKQVLPDHKVVYYYSDAQTTHTTYPDGLQVLHFPSNQIEKHYMDGTKEIIFPDQTVKYLYQSGDEECVFADGTIERVNRGGDRVVEFPNGQRETYTKLFKKREYPDGTVKTVFTDGRQETRYPSGRLRVKDGEGRLLVDTADSQESL